MTATVAEPAAIADRAELLALFELPLNDLLYRAQQVHRLYHDPNRVQRSTLLSIKTGGCTEDCKYCSQSTHYNTGLENEKLMNVDEVLQAARAAKDSGATRFCMGAAWRNPQGKAFERVKDMVKGVSDMGLETCATLGMLDEQQARELKEAGLDYYNHNLDTAPEIYSSIITTRTYQDRLDTLDHVRKAGLSVCSGGIVGMGESRAHRAGLIAQLAGLDPYPESVPINMLVRIDGTPLGGIEAFDGIEFVRTIAVTRIAMPKTMVRLSAGRETMSDELQALCYFAGANSIFYGEKLLTTPNPGASRDELLFRKLGIQGFEGPEPARLEQRELRAHAH